MAEKEAIAASVKVDCKMNGQHTKQKIAEKRMKATKQRQRKSYRIFELIVKLIKQRLCQLYIEIKPSQRKLTSMVFEIREVLRTA